MQLRPGSIRFELGSCRMFGDTLLGSSSLVRLLERAVAALSKATCVKSHETSRASKARRKLSTRTTTTALLKGVFNLGYEFFT